MKIRSQDISNRSDKHDFFGIILHPAKAADLSTARNHLQAPKTKFSVAMVGMVTCGSGNLISFDFGGQ